MSETITLLSGSESILLPTGYATVMSNLLFRLSKMGYDCYHIGWQHFGKAQDYLGDNKGVITQLYPGLARMHEADFPDNFERYIRKYKPDCCFSLIDYWYTGAMTKHSNEFGIPYVNYFPVDGEPFYTGWIDSLKEIHTPLAMSKYGRNVVKDAVRKSGIGGWKYHFDMDVMYHGVDIEIFHKLPKSTNVNNRAKVFGKNHIDSFVLGVVGKNCFRKQHTRVLEAFAKFAKNKDDVILVMKVGDPANVTGQGNSIYDFIGKLDVDENKIKFMDTGHDLTVGVDPREMASLYNLFDVHISATSGEGFGLTTIEAGACGVPSILTDYTTSRELIEDRGWLVPINDHVTGEWNINRGLVNIDMMADAMEEAYQNKKLRKEYSRKMLKFCESLSWDIIAKQCNKIIRSAMES